MKKSSTVLIWCLISTGGVATWSQQAGLDVGTGAGSPGATVSVPIDLATDQSIVALQLDLTFSSSVLTANGATVGGAAIDHLLDSAMVGATYRLVVYSPANTPLASGRLADVTFTIAGAASPQTVPIGITAVVLSDSDAGAIAPTLLDPGSVEVQPAPTPTDLTVGKSGYMDSLEQVFFTVTVANNGPNVASGATVVDTLPPEIATASWTCFPTGGATCPAGPLNGSLNAQVDLPVSGQVVFEATSTLAVPPGGTTTNTATVAVPGGMSDTNAANDSAQVVVPLTPAALFADGFETGDTGQWSSASGFTSLRLELDLDPDTRPGLLLRALSSGRSDPFRLEVREAAGGIEVRAVLVTVEDPWVSSWQPLGGASRFRLHWWSGRPPGARNGGLRMWLDGRLVVDATGIENAEVEGNGLSYMGAAGVVAISLDGSEPDPSVRILEVGR